jgi:hypothetical protein
MPSQLCRAIGVVTLLLLAGCSYNSKLDVPTVVPKAPTSATQLSSDNPEIPGAPPLGPARF